MFLKRIGENSEIEMRILRTSLNQDGGVGFLSNENISTTINCFVRRLYWNKQ